MGLKILIRSARGRDLERLNGIINDPEVARYLTVRPPLSMKSTREHYRELRKAGNLWHVISVDGVVAGSLTMTFPKRHERRHTMGIGLSLAKEYWGLGLGGRAIDHALSEARRRGLRRTELSVFPGNGRAMRLYRSRGFEREGVKRKALKIKGRYYDEILMARLI